MRTSAHDFGWVLNEAGKMQGFGLGYDFVAEHEYGIKDMNKMLGITTMACPVGLKDRQMTVVPERLVLQEYMAQPRDRRCKPYKAAMLSLLSRWSHPPEDISEFARVYEVTFIEPFNPKAPNEENMCIGWDSESFAIHVRGEENIANLRTLHEAFQRCDIVTSLPGGKRRAGPFLVMVSTLSEVEIERIESIDLAHKRLIDAVIDSGIERTLRDAGKQWYALAPDWYDHEKEEGLVFFLNPREQELHNFGWFTLDELKAWAENKGPIMVDKKLNAFDKSHASWEYNLVSGMEKQGVGMRFGPHLAWMDEQQTVVGIQIYPAPRFKDQLPVGLYEFNALVEKYAPPEKAAA